MPRRAPVLLTFLALAVAALATSPGAAAHGGGGALGYRSTVTAVSPAAPGVRVEVLEGDDRLFLESAGGETVVVLGYDGEPYLRVTPEGVFRNVHSPATYLNEDRYGDVPLPDTADAEAPPEWERIDDDPRVEWHDHRIHWMSKTSPPSVRDDEDAAQHILDWEVPLEVDGRPVTIAGSLDYEPPDEGSFSLVLLVPLGALALAGAAGWWLRRR